MQQELAARVGVSRQSLSAIEAGATAPSTALALELARALSCRVEDLFALDAPEGPLPVALAPPLGAPGPAAARVRVGCVQGVWVAHRLEPDAPTPADGPLLRARR